MKVEELIGSNVWFKNDRFRSVSGKIKEISNSVNVDDIRSSVSQSTFKIEMLSSGDVIEMPGSDLLEIDHANYAQESRPA
jgi:hypothetical protein